MKIMIMMLDYAQWTAAMKIGFGGFLSVNHPQNLAIWLLQNFDPTSNTLKLFDSRILKITKEDVHATLALPIGPLKVQVASTCEPKMNTLNSLNNGGQGEILVKQGHQKLGRWLNKFYKEETMEKNSKETLSMNDNCFFRILKSLMDRKEIRGLKVSHSNINKDENEFPGEYGRGKTINRIDYQLIILEGEGDLGIGKHGTEKPRAHQTFYSPCSKCGSERELPMAGPNDSIKKCLNEVGDHGLTQDEHFFNDPKFFDAYKKMEAVALKHYQCRTPMDYTLPTFNLGIPLSLEGEFLL
ncbi:LOW QUALITY PROTEIN: hypothetical protein Cgig2_014454 [Carnegiea gigantea]|uniref:Uncharacterized protein n=1 Tax=Carnegiea gigantea TaxID=171969 RepID=A0A9Q1QER0_9CARY|nr:LOW QUALITY PROTEIN: hypothetical protein Cgig2_014454 [Carnegiea gigantea]